MGSPSMEGDRELRTMINTAKVPDFRGGTFHPCLASPYRLRKGEGGKWKWVSFTTDFVIAIFFANGHKLISTRLN